MKTIFTVFFLLLVNNIVLTKNLPNLLLEKTKVDSIIIKGNETTQDFIILREITFNIGDEVDSTIIHFNRERIFSLALFNRVEIRIEKKNDKNIVVIEVDESWYIYPLPFWYTKTNSLESLTYGISILRKNFRGRNETIRAVLGYGYDKFFTIQYDNPAFSYYNEIGLSALTSFTSFKNINKQAAELNNGEYNYKLFRISAGIRKRLNQFIQIGSSLSFDYWESSVAPKGAITASGKRMDRLPGLSIFQIYDTRDLKLFSHDGIYTYTNYSHKGFGNDNISYNTFEIDLRGYNKLIGKLSSKIRFFHRRTFGSLIPYYDYSFLGYSEKIRGHSNKFYEGNNSIITSAELSYPLLSEWNLSFKLPLIPQSLTSARVGIQINIFADAGTAFNNGEPILIRKVNSGYGIGLILLLLPYNAFRLEYAVDQFGKGEVLLATGFSF